ncbi:hypothetical protein JI739_24120 [Ramlibacter sp. AW1]|uniref:Uncharacterized protein n=1 Tax=Ramlibacter aurantiacus TaxID=2801330 RepID=A0A937D9Q7_9BURK|nr:hypothetical protein [Ramlibacter aurantiacus]MBL0423441.1 hypothetical protein [Ramlibacter aurantiacus]
MLRKAAVLKHCGNRGLQLTLVTPEIARFGSASHGSSAALFLDLVEGYYNTLGNIGPHLVDSARAKLASQLSGCEIFTEILGAQDESLDAWIGFANEDTNEFWYTAVEMCSLQEVVTAFIHSGRSEVLDTVERLRQEHQALRLKMIRYNGHKLTQDQWIELIDLAREIAHAWDYGPEGNVEPRTP